MSITWPQLETGSAILKSASVGWTNFAVVTTRSPWKRARSHVPEPTRLQLVGDLDRKSLGRLAEECRGLDLIVGIGSGLAMDSAKFLAKTTGAALVQVPSTSSNNACFTRTAWTFEGGARIPERECPIPRQLVLDTELLQAAPARLNRAGAAEILCSHTALFDWRLGHHAGLDVQWDDDLERFTHYELSALARLAPAIGADRLEAFVEIVEAGARFAEGFTTHPKARFNGASEHVFSWALEEVSGKRLIHGEAVSLGVVLMAHIQGNDPEGAADVLRDARIAFKPEDIGVTWRDVDETIAGLPEYAKRVPWYTLLNEFASRGKEGSRDLTERYASAREFVRRLQ
jgi:glycerol-1-phosphate dehydrogenase [NAD(P)+]